MLISIKQTVYADILKANPDKTGKYENAYIAAITLGRAALNTVIKSITPTRRHIRGERG